MYEYVYEYGCRKQHQASLSYSYTYSYTRISLSVSEYRSGVIADSQHEMWGVLASSGHPVIVFNDSAVNDSVIFFCHSAERSEFVFVIFTGSFSLTPSVFVRLRCDKCPPWYAKEDTATSKFLSQEPCTEKWTEIFVAFAISIDQSMLRKLV